MATAYEDPPEYRGGGATISFPPIAQLTKKLIWINAGVFLFFFALVPRSDAVRALYEGLGLNLSQWREWFPLVPLWQLLTYGFLHDTHGIGHLFFNCLGLYFFGSMVEQAVGARRYLWLYLAAIAFGGAAELLVDLPTGRDPLVVGASGAVLFLIVVAAVLNPSRMVIFIFVPMRLRTMALIFVGLDLFALISPGASGKALTVHLAGAAFGFAAAKLGWIWVDPLEALQKRRDELEEQREGADVERLDELLARIHREGIGSLSASEREFLKRVSKRGPKR